MKIWRFIDYYLLGRQVNSREEIRASDLEGKISKLKAVEVGIEVYKEIQDEYCPTARKVGEQNFQAETGKQAYLQIRDFICEIDKFDLGQTKAHYIKYKHRKENRHFVEATITGKSLVFMIKLEEIASSD